MQKFTRTSIKQSNESGNFVKNFTSCKKGEDDDLVCQNLSPKQGH